MYPLGINFDEISDDLHEAIRVMKACGVTHGELRTVNAKNFVFWTDDEVDVFKEVIRTQGIEVMAAASPLFKWYRNENEADVERARFGSFGFNPRLSEERKWAIIENAIYVAARLSLPRLRVFSGLGRTRAPGRELAHDPLFKAMLKLAAEQGIDIYIENEPICRVHTKQDIIELFDTTESSNLKLWLDIANLIEIGEEIDAAFLHTISPRLGYLHVKDYVMRDNRKVYVPVGEGMMNYQSIFEQISAAHPNNDVVVTIETHVKENKAHAAVTSILRMRNILNTVMP